MERTTVSLDEETQAIVDEKSGDGEEYESASEFVRECIRSYEEIENLEQEVAELRAANDDLREQRDERNERIDELENEMASLQDELEDKIASLQKNLEDAETDVERLQNEKEEILAAREENQALVRYVEDERRVEQQWRETPVWTRVKWRVFGMPSESSA